MAGMSVERSSRPLIHADWASFYIKEKRKL